MTSTLTSLLSELIGFESTAGREAKICTYVRNIIAKLFDRVIEIPVSPGRFNVFGYNGSPRIVFSTHLDVVDGDSQLFKARFEKGRIYGRGACDAKGIVACMLETSARLLRQGQSEFGVLFVVGEESSGDGAAAARAYLSELETCYVVNGEPTELKAITSQFGASDYRLRISGRACHSGYPERGIDANRLLLEALIALEKCVLNCDQNALVNFGRIIGGTAANVVSAEAEARLCIRSELSCSQIFALIKSCLPQTYQLETGFQSQPIKPLAIPGYESTIAKFASDLPTLISGTMQGVLFGPGDIHLAHTQNESIALSELEAGVLGYEKIYYYLRGKND